jgi:hypothetical protein
MFKIDLKISSVSVESIFKNAVLFKDSHLDQVAQKSLETLSAFGLKPTQIASRAGDQIYNYDLSFPLFNGAGTFRISAEKSEVTFLNATTEKDLEIVLQCVSRIYEHVPMPPCNTSSISANAQVVFALPKEGSDFLDSHVDSSKQIGWGGVLAYVICPNWTPEVRLVIDKSMVYQDGLFLTWSTTHLGNNISLPTLNAAGKAFVDAIEKFGLTFSKSHGHE